MTANVNSSTAKKSAIHLVSISSQLFTTAVWLMAESQATQKERVTSISMAIIFGPQLNSFCPAVSTELSRFMYDSLAFISLFRAASCRSRDPKSDRKSVKVQTGFQC